MVIATQNPHDRVGTFPLPQAQLDRFMCQVIVQAPGLEEQSKILMQTNQNNITEKISLNLTTS
jgi:MoxR-like ATPase